MNQGKMLSRSAGVLLLLVFGFNVYIGLYDTTLSRLSTLHHTLNWLIALITLATSIPLIVRPLSKIWRSLCGIAWPLVYIISLFLDVETLLCLGTNLACWPSVTDAYDYLILGSKVEGWVLWPYTIRVAISILVIVIILTTLALVMSRKATKTRASETNERSGGGAAQKEQHPN